jgi:hypothetical protein
MPKFGLSMGRDPDLCSNIHYLEQKMMDQDVVRLGL